MNNILKRSILAYAALIALFSTVLILGQSSATADKQWRLTAIDGKPVEQTRAFISINDEMTRFTGHTGCNRMFGSIKVDGAKAELGAVGTTKMACLSDDLNAIEKGVVSAMSKVNGIRQNGDTLELLEGNRVALQFEDMNKTGESKLEDKKWVLESIAGKTITLAASKPFVNFDLAKGSLGGDTGCNVFGGSLSVKGNSFDASKMISTMRACEEDGRMTIERQLLDCLEKADRFEIKGNKLTLFEKNAILLTFVGEKK